MIEIRGRSRAAPLMLAACLCLIACSGGDDAAPVNTITTSEAQALNDAAAMLDENAVTANKAGD